MVRELTGFQQSQGICADASNDLVFVSDTRSGGVLVLNLSDGKLVRRIGSYGKGPAQFKSPRGLCVLPDNQLGVCDWETSRTS